MGPHRDTLGPIYILGPQLKPNLYIGAPIGPRFIYWAPSWGPIYILGPQLGPNLYIGAPIGGPYLFIGPPRAHINLFWASWGPNCLLFIFPVGPCGFPYWPYWPCVVDIVLRICGSARGSHGLHRHVLASAAAAGRLPIALSG